MEIRVCKRCGSAPYLLTRKLKRYGYEPKHCYRCRFCDSETKLYWNPEDAQMAWNQMNEPDEIQTNADKIRAMSDEKLANLIAQNTVTGACNDFGIPAGTKCTSICTVCILEWLKQPAKEDNHG